MVMCGFMACFAFWGGFWQQCHPARAPWESLSPGNLTQSHGRGQGRLAGCEARKADVPRVLPEGGGVQNPPVSHGCCWGEHRTFLVLPRAWVQYCPAGCRDASPEVSAPRIMEFVAGGGMAGQRDPLCPKFLRQRGFQRLLLSSPYLG